MLRNQLLGSISEVDRFVTIKSSFRLLTNVDENVTDDTQLLALTAFDGVTDRMITICVASPGGQERYNK
jgi:hypothetical protein